jgi:hypothetical protein
VTRFFALALLPAHALAHTAWLDASAGRSGSGPVLAPALGFDWEAEKWAAGADASLSLAPGSGLHASFGAFGEWAPTDALSLTLSGTGAPRSGSTFACEVEVETLDGVKTVPATCGSFSASAGGALGAGLALELGGERALLFDLSLGVNVMQIEQTVTATITRFTTRTFRGAFNDRLIQGRARAGATLVLGAWSLDVRGEFDLYDKPPATVGQIDGRELLSSSRLADTRLTDGKRLSGVSGLSRGLPAAPVLFSAGGGAGWQGESLRASLSFDWLQYTGAAGAGQVLSLRGGWTPSTSWDLGLSLTVQRDAVSGLRPDLSVYGGLQAAWMF